MKKLVFILSLLSLCLLSSCGNYEFLEETEIFMIKTHNVPHYYLKNGDIIKLDFYRDGSIHSAPDYVRKDGKEGHFVASNATLWLSAEEGWKVKIFSHTVDNKYSYELVAPDDIIDRELTITKLSVYDGETGKMVGVLNGGFLSSPSGKIRYEHYQGKIILNITFTDGSMTTINTGEKPIWLEAVEGQKVIYNRINGLSVYKLI